MAAHDSLYHRLFSQPLMVEQILRDFVPELEAADLDFARMERVVAKFHDRSGRRRDGDVIWRIPSRAGGEMYLYLLLEFQSQNDWWMAVRAQVYEGLLWQQVIAEQRLKPGDLLPPVLLLVLHNGHRPWTAPTTTAELVGLPDTSPLWPWQPHVHYYLLDMAALPEDVPANRDSLAALLVRLEQGHDPAGLAGLIDEVVGWFRRHPDAPELQRLFTELVRQAIVGTAPQLPVPDDLREIRTMLATLGEEWKRQWLAEGRAEGRAEGEAKGRAEGRAEGEAKGRAEVLIRFAEARFGPLSDAQRQRIQAASADDMAALTDRLMQAQSVADWLDGAA